MSQAGEKKERKKNGGRRPASDVAGAHRDICVLKRHTSESVGASCSQRGSSWRSWGGPSGSTRHQTQLDSSGEGQDVLKASCSRWERRSDPVSCLQLIGMTLKTVNDIKLSCH